MADSVIERFSVPLPHCDVQWQGVILPTRRTGGRRIQVHDRAGVLLFDSLDCFDKANAINKLDEWLTSVVGAIVRPTPVVQWPEPAELPALVGV